MKRTSYYRRRRMLLAYIFFLLLLSVAILLMPFGNNVNEESSVLMYISGFLFWIGMIGTIGMVVYINLSRRRSLVFKELYPELRRFGLIHFFQNRHALIADIVMFATLIVFIITKLLIDSLVLQFVLIACFVFSFGLHCMMNGTNYVYINHKGRRLGNYEYKN